MINPSLNRGEIIPNHGVSDVSGVVKRGIFRGTATRKRMEKAKAKRKIPGMSQRVMDLML